MRRAALSLTAILCLGSLGGCVSRPAPPEIVPPEVAALLRAHGYSEYGDTTGDHARIEALCSVQTGGTRFDLYWYEMQHKPASTWHANYALIQIRDGVTYDGSYAVGADKPVCRPDVPALDFGPPELPATVGVGDEGLPRSFVTDGELRRRAS